MAAKRPFKILYLNNAKCKCGRLVAVSSPEAVVRSAALALITAKADCAEVYLDGFLFASMETLPNGAVSFDPARWDTAKVMPAPVP